MELASVVLNVSVDSVVNRAPAVLVVSVDVVRVQRGSMFFDGLVD